MNEENQWNNVWKNVKIKIMKKIQYWENENE